MFVIGIRKRLFNAGWRCLHQESGPVATKNIAPPKTSGIIVTGDEVLKGQILDTNSYFLCKKLYERGIKVVSVSKVADDRDKIAEAVKKYSDEYDYVLTTGGVGPTHDDVTYAAVAQAFNDTLFYHPELSKIVLNFYKSNDSNHPALKMAYIPTTSVLTYGYDPVLKIKSLYPNISVKNVYTFPGVPQLCERLFTLTENELFKSSEKFHLKELYLSANEGKIVGYLNEIISKFPHVTFGSYPKFFHSYYSVKIGSESININEVNEAFEFMKNLIPKEFQVNYDPNPFENKKDKLEALKDDLITESLISLRKVVTEHNPNNIFLYFDGGKNSTLLLHLLSILFDEIYPKSYVNGIYIERNPKINDYVFGCMKHYKLNIITLSEENFNYFAKCNPRMCIVKGTRSSDPEAPKIFKSFDGLSVVNPLKNWTYKKVWNCIRGLNLPYCELYDQGYTSICKNNPVPNPYLITSGPRQDHIYYKKAYDLSNPDLESFH